VKPGDDDSDSGHFQLPDLDTSQARVPVRTTQRLGGEGHTQHRSDDADPQSLRAASRWAWWTFALGTGAVVGGIALGATPLLLVAPPAAALALRAGLHAQARKQPALPPPAPHGISSRAQALLARTREVQAELEVSGLDESIQVELRQSLDRVPERVQSLESSRTRLERSQPGPEASESLSGDLALVQSAMADLEAGVEGIRLGLSQLGAQAPTPGVESQLRQQADALQATALQMREPSDETGGDSA
jgi:hypothetical protein